MYNPLAVTKVVTAKIAIEGFWSGGISPRDHTLSWALTFWGSRIAEVA